MFNKPYQMTMHHVHDRVRFSEGYDSLSLLVDEEPDRMVAGLIEAQKLMKAIQTQEDAEKAARFFAGVLFGDAQAEKLLEFYHQNAACVLEVCCRYFADRLQKLITKAQKRKHAIRTK